MEKRFNWRLAALASAVALLGGLASLQAHALGLGRISVQSALGEPLRAEIDIAEISADEASSLKASVAQPEAFRAAGLEYSAFIADLQISVQKRADGRSFLRLSSARAITEPFVDLILEANWSSGRIVRDYTMLFDPPNLRQAAAAPAVTAPLLPRPAPPAAPAPATAIGTPNYPTNPPPAQAAVRPTQVVKAPPVKITPAAPKAAVPGGQQLAVKPGDTAGKIAAQVKPVSVSLDQMLTAMLRSNPDAFIGGNINRLKAGSVLDIPGPDELGAISATDASKTIIAQSKDFNDFRRKLAESVPAARTGNASREAGGKVQAKVEDKAPIAATPDKLTLSKGAVQSKAATEDKIAQDRQAKEASERVAELAKNIGDLNKLTGVPPAAVSAAASTVKGTGIAVANPGALPAASAVMPPPAATVMPGTPASAVVATTVQPAASAASAAAAQVTASAPAAVASTTAATASQAAAVSATAAAPSPPPEPGKNLVVAAPQLPAEPSLIDELTENPFLLPGFAGLLALLAGFGFYRYRQRHNSTQVDSSFLESRLQPDSFFGASGGQRIDTNEGGATGSSLVYSPSQLDAAGDVDPVAEADVYLAYGRDLQAEEILKEAMRTTPNRVAVHAKLMEIYAKRRDVKAFEVTAMEAFNLTHGEGPEWAYISEMGRELDPSNALYQPGGQPADGVYKNDAHAPAMAVAFGVDTMPQKTQPMYEPASAPVDFDLDLDFSLGDEPASVAAAQPLQTTEITADVKAAPAPSFDGLDIDFDTGTVATNPVVTTPSAPAPHVDEKAADEALLASGLTFTNEPFTPVRPSATPAAAVMDHGMLEFDMGSLSLELDGPTTESPMPTADAAVAAADGPLETKFALAEEFRALGDMDGARALAEEVLTQAKGSLKSKAQAFVNALS